MSDKFDGFEQPNYTQVPNKFFDEIMSQIKYKSELIVTLAIIRKTFGWHKGADRISQSQLTELTGMNRKSVKRGLEYGVERGTIVKLDDYSLSGEAAKYALNFKNFNINKDDLNRGHDDPSHDNPSYDDSRTGVTTTPEQGSPQPLQKKGLNKNKKSSNRDDYYWELFEALKEPYKDMLSVTLINTGHLDIIIQLMRANDLELDLVLHGMQKTKRAKKPTIFYLEDKLNRWIEAEITSLSQLEANSNKNKDKSDSKPNNYEINRKSDHKNVDIQELINQTYGADA
ncbi:replication protein [Orenia marismortui]|uniref:Phage replication protein O n=1 Tax=Orenia marismortui TaxID=46469 RepID=A0A4V3GXK5_9FIRM|nr:replication protein [Orenia marismortui]TDX48305.1 phage replication protein O [Orenia marismortui]